MREQLDESLETAEMFQRLIDVFRDVTQQTLVENPATNDELSLLIATAHRGLGSIAVQLFNVAGMIEERITWLGKNEGFVKLVPPVKAFNDRKEDFLYYEEPQDEWHQSDASDEDEYRDEWEIEDFDDGYNDSTPEE